MRKSLSTQFQNLEHLEKINLVKTTLTNSSKRKLVNFTKNNDIDLKIREPSVLDRKRILYLNVPVIDTKVVENRIVWFLMDLLAD